MTTKTDTDDIAVVEVKQIKKGLADALSGNPLALKKKVHTLMDNALDTAIDTLKEQTISKSESITSPYE